MTINIPEVSNFDAGVYQYQTTDKVIGGAGGTANAPLVNLTNRTRWLYNAAEAVAGQVSSAVDGLASSIAGVYALETWVESLYLPLAGGTVTGDLTVNGTAYPQTLKVNGLTYLFGAAVYTYGTLNVAGLTTINGAIVVDGTMNVGGAAVLSGSLTVDQSSTIIGTLTVGAVNVGGEVNTVELAVSGSSTLSGELSVTGNVTVRASITVDDNVYVDEALAVGGNTTLNGTLGVTGASVFAGAVIMENNLLVDDTLTATTLGVVANASVQGTLGVVGKITANTEMYLYNGFYSSGGCYIGTSINNQGESPSGTSTPGMIMYPNGNIDAYSSGWLLGVPNGDNFAAFLSPGQGSVGSIHNNGSSVSYNTNSDRRLKQDIAPLPDALERMARAVPKRFAFKANPGQVVDGFIADEISAVVPEAVIGEPDGEQMQQLEQSRLVPVMYAAILQLKANAELAENQAKVMQATILDLQAKLNATHLS